MTTERKLEPTPGWCERAMGYIRQIHRMGINTGRSFSLINEYEAAKPATAEPLPHEWRAVGASGDLTVYTCPHCLQASHATRPDQYPPPGVCPIRNAPKPEPSTIEGIRDELAGAVAGLFPEPAVSDFVAAVSKREKADLDSRKRLYESFERYSDAQTPEPAAKDAELPEVPDLPKGVDALAWCVINGDARHDALMTLCRVLLGESRRIADERIGKAKIEVRQLNKQWRP